MEKSTSPISTEEMSSKRKNFIEVPIDNIKAEDETKEKEIEVSNEKPNNKIMKLSGLTNMDPLEYFSRFLGIPEMILKHFNGKDVLTASEVSPSWYNFSASSKVLMQKTKVVFDRHYNLSGGGLIRIPHEFPLKYQHFMALSTDLMKIKIDFKDKSANMLEGFNLLKNSSRMYQNIEILRSAVIVTDENRNRRRFGDYMTGSELDFFNSKAHEWKHVLLSNVYFRKKLDLWKLLSAIEPSVERITVNDFGALPFEDPSSEIESFENLKFSKLKQLGVAVHENNSFGEAFVRFFLKSVAIEELHLADYSGKVDKDILKQILETFDRLTGLRIVSKFINQIFEDEFYKKFQFKLKNLSILNARSREPFRLNFLNFLKSQSDHLESLMIYVEDKETFDVIMKMPKLKKLSVMHFVAFSENEFPIQMSTTITEVRLFKCASAVGLKSLLDLMPKVRKLELFSIDENDFQMLKSMKRKFEILGTCEMKGVDRKDLEEIMTENYTLLATNLAKNYFLTL